MNIAIVGSRELKPWYKEQVQQYVHDLPDHYNIFSGGAIGVDSWAAEASLEKNGRLIELMPNYNKWGPNVAPLKRNEKVVLYCH